MILVGENLYPFEVPQEKPTLAYELLEIISLAEYIIKPICIRFHKPSKYYYFDLNNSSGAFI